jgi:hypothetical protein
MTKQEINQMLPATEEPASKDYSYMEGSPLTYRWNAKDGNLYVDWITGLEKIADAKEGFKICPFAVRAFEGEGIFGRTKTDESGNEISEKWVELFFVNRRNHICSLLFHGYSVENLSDLAGKLQYDNKGIRDVILSVMPDKKTGPNGEYYIADFLVTDNVTWDWETPAHVYRYATLHTGKNQRTLFYENFSLPAGDRPPELKE